MAFTALQQQVVSNIPREVFTLSNNPAAQRQDLASDDISQGAIKSNYGKLSCLFQIKRQISFPIIKQKLLRKK